MNPFKRIAELYDYYTRIEKIEIPQSLAMQLEIEPDDNGFYYAEADVCISIKDCCRAIHLERGILAQNINLNHQINEH